MNIDESDGQRGVSINQYLGVPNEPDAQGEKGRWRRFLEWAMPWLKQKWGLGEAVVAAKAAQEVAKARLMMAEARKAELETLALARKIEEEKLAAIPSAVAEPADLTNEMRAVIDRLEVLAWKHGTRVEVGVRADSGGSAGKFTTELLRDLLDAHRHGNRSGPVADPAATPTPSPTGFPATDSNK